MPIALVQLKFRHGVGVISILIVIAMWIAVLTVVTFAIAVLTVVTFAISIVAFPALVFGLGIGSE